MEFTYNENQNIEGALSELSSLMDPSEKLIKLLPGYFCDVFGLLVATSERIIFVNKRSLLGTPLTIPYTKLLNMTFQKTSSRRCDVVMQTKDGEKIITDCDSCLAEDIVYAVESLINSNLDFMG